jgi:flagellar biosynthesis anti-sigma factor FlgM
MKITQRGPADTDVSSSIQNEKAVESRKTGEARSESSSAFATVNISREARELQQIAELSQTGDELRAEKMRQVKQQVLSGEYHVKADEVAKSILRSEVSRILKG